MVNDFFSEYTFAFAASHEVISSTYPRRSPILPFFPSLRAEVHLGYDMWMPLPGQTSALCLQYKIVTPVKRIGFKSSLTMPCFRCKINRDQNAHLRKQVLNKFNVYYCAPLFCTVSEIELHFSNKRILGNSVFLPPPKWPDTAASHRLIVDKKCEAYLCSEPEHVTDIYSYDAMISRQAERKQDTSQLLVSLHEILKDSLEQAGQVWDNFETDLAFINSLPGDEFRAQLKNHWRYQWIKTALAVSYGLDFHLV